MQKNKSLLITITNCTTLGILFYNVNYKQYHTEYSYLHFLMCKYECYSRGKNQNVMHQIKGYAHF